MMGYDLWKILPILIVTAWSISCVLSTNRALRKALREGGCATIFGRNSATGIYSYTSSD